MSEATRYPVPARRRRIAEEVKRSRFIATVDRVSSVEEAEAFVDEIRSEFADATHNCWAYVVGPPGTTGAIGMSDDGEPHGTAGKPMLKMLLHGDVGDVAAVVTRYFGGTKLGTGGLVRAYGGAVQRALDDLPRVERVESRELRVRVDYSAASAVRQITAEHEARIAAEDYAEDVTYRILLPVERVDGFRSALLDATRGQAEIEPADAS